MTGTTSDLTGLRVGALLDRYPFVSQFLGDEGVESFLDDPEWTLERSLQQHLKTHPDLPAGWERSFLQRMGRFIEEMLDFVSEETERVERVTIRGGRAKDGSPEPVEELTVALGEVICIVGPTGSGKSRLLADIEWVAQGDTPTGRSVLINGAEPERRWRFSTEHKLVAQLSQNMNFVMDLTVQEFLALHAESRQLEAPEQTIHHIWESANALAGEPFALDTPITSLSGGQSRALMIADTAVLSRSPIVLIDEIENAGIDRRRALDTLLREEKIVLMATHDPILALYGHRRVVLRNGAMERVIQPTDKELANVEQLRAIDARMMALRNRLRQGELLEEI
ncbi:MAG: ATP-binding cassette domain-containing protein [Deltaproteobacteria bacterium]|jgi:ABC-type lipoprotein export system ATPase subunit|nr:ATP-binding cassette domain-containing protein [Deltaproteobacteria bacterium]